MKKQSRANFCYRIGTVDTKKVLLIWDQNRGNKSVTNDIENVVADIAEHEKIDPITHLILYRDSEGNWDGWNAYSGAFFFPQPEVRQRITEALADSKPPKTLPYEKG